MNIWSNKYPNGVKEFGMRYAKTLRTTFEGFFT